MSADENVDIKVSADNAAALTALEQIAAALEKLGEKGKHAGEKNKEGSDWAADGFKVFTERLVAATSAAAIADKVFEGINKQLADMRDRAREAWEAQQKAAGVQASWAELLPEGSDPAKIQSRIDEIAKATHNRSSDVGSAFAQALGSAGENQTVDQVLDAVAAAGRQHRDSGRMASFGGEILKLQKAFPKLDAAQAAAGILSHGDKSDFAERILPAMVELRHIGGERDTPQFLESFVAAAGKTADVGNLKGMFNKIRPYLPEESLGKWSVEQIVEYLKSDKGKMARSRLFGPLAANPELLQKMPREELDLIMAGQMGFQRSDPNMLDRELGYFTGSGDPAARAAAAAELGFDRYGAASQAKAAAQQAVTAATPEAQLAARTRAAKKAEIGTSKKVPLALVAEARAARDEFIHEAGTGFLGYKNWGRDTLDYTRGQINTPKKQIEAAQWDMEEFRDPSNPALEQHYQDQLKVMQDILQAIRDQEITIRTTGGEGINPQTAAVRAGK